MKNTKQELFDAYDAALKELERVKALKESPADVMEEKRKLAMEENAAKAVESNIFSEEITQQYKDLQESIESKKAVLKELYDIESNASSLAAIINATKEKQYQLEADYKARKVELDNEHKAEVDKNQAELKEMQEAINLAKKEVRDARADELEKVHLERKREEEEYNYNLKRQRKIENDEWEDEKTEREKAIAAREEQARTMFQDAEAKLDLVEELQEKVDEIPNMIEEAEKQAKETAYKEAAKEYSYKKTMYEKEKEYEISKLEDRAAMLEEKLKSEEQKSAELQAKLDEAYTRMNTLASDTVKANGAVRIVSSGSNPTSK